MSWEDARSDPSSCGCERYAGTENVAFGNIPSMIDNGDLVAAHESGSAATPMVSAKRMDWI